AGAPMASLINGRISSRLSAGRVGYSGAFHGETGALYPDAFLGPGTVAVAVHVVHSVVHRDRGFLITDLFNFFGYSDYPARRQNQQPSDDNEPGQRQRKS